MKKVKLKKKKTKRLFKLFLLGIILLISISFTIKNLSKNVDINNKEYLSLLINDSFKNKDNYRLIVGLVLKTFSSADLEKPESFLTFNHINKTKKDYNVKEKYIKEDNYDPELYNKKTSYITVENNIEDPVLYIYNTHQLETYSNEGLDNIEPNVMMAGVLLKDKLNKNGVKTIFEDTNLYNFISEMGLPKDELYGGSRVFISNAKEKYSTLKYYIDIHRDSVEKDISTIEINNKKYARVLFVLGTTNPNYNENRVMMESISNIINEKYPKLSRGIYEVDIPDWSEIYNQDLDKNVILIELGAKENTMNEVLNTVDVLSIAISQYIKEDK